MPDRQISHVLADAGFITETEQLAARRALEANGLTRPGKRNISESKLGRIEGVLANGFAFACDECVNIVRDARLAAVLIRANDGRCERCEGSDHRAAVLRFVARCQSRAVRKVVVVGGSPTTRHALARQVQGLELRLVDGTVPLNARRARELRTWGDLVLIWGSTQLDHRVSRLFTSPRDRETVVVSRRGLAALLDGGTKHLEGPLAG